MIESAIAEPTCATERAGLLAVSRTSDYALVGRLMRHPRVFPWLVDDSSPPAAEFTPSESELVYYLLVRRDNIPVGVFVFAPENGATIQVHTCLTPQCWGPKAIEATALAKEWIFANTRFQRITTAVPADNALAERLALQSGLLLYGVNPRSFLRGGVLVDQYLFGCNKD